MTSQLKKKQTGYWLDVSTERKNRHGARRGPVAQNRSKVRKKGRGFK